MKFLNTLFLSALAIPALAETVDFHRDVAPILREYCVGCHNNDDLEGELSVETFQLLMKGGENGTPIKAGDRAESLLAKVITKQAKLYMPPCREPQLSPAQVDTLRGGSIRCEAASRRSVDPRQPQRPGGRSRRQRA